MSQPISRTLLSFAAALLLQIIGRPIDAQAPQQSGKPSRVAAPGSWQIIREIGRDSPLIENPGPAALGAGRVVLFDYGSNSVKSFRLDGSLEWNAGRRGRGPGEYAAPVSLVLDSAGHALIYDPDNSRLTILGRDGKLLRTVALRGKADIALPGPRGGHYLLLNSASDTLVATSDSSGIPRLGTALPANMRSAAPITREIAGVAPTTTGYLAAFRWSSRMILLDGKGNIVRSCDAIDSLSLPERRQNRLTVQGIKVRIDRVDPNAREAALSLATLGSSVLVLRESVTRRGARQVDVYAANCGRYIETRPFPFVAGRIIGNADVVVAIVLEPAPHLAVLKWMPARR